MKKVLLFVQLCLLTLTMNAVTMVQVSLEEALAVVKSHFIGQNVDYYLCGSMPSWKIFVDAEPLSGWEHTCYLYSIRRAHKDTENMIVTCEELTLPPADDMTPLDVQNFVSDTPNATPYVPQATLTNAVLTAAERTYAVILSGGVNKNSNYVRYWNDCSFIYQTLVKKYGVPKDNINVIMSDGTDPAADMKLMDLSYVSSPLDLDGDSYDDIEYSATRTNVQSVLNSLSSTLQKDDHLFIFVIDHGGSTDGITHSYINLWGNEKLYDYELANWLTPFTDNYVNVNVVLGQCFSGGFIDDLTMNGCVVATACTGSEYSWACNNLIYDEFVYQWTSAVNNARPNGGYVYSDTDNNGVVTMLEAFEYAKNNDQKPAEHPQYISTPASVGEDLGFNQIAPSVDLYIRDNVADTGKEPNVKEDRIYWCSPDIWVRNQPDSIEAHENPEYYDNHTSAYVYIRIHNRGKEDYNGDSLWIHAYWAQAATALSKKVFKGYETYNNEFVTGEHFRAKKIPHIQSGESVLVQFQWLLPEDIMENENLSPDLRHHFCLLARIMDSHLDDGFDPNSPEGPLSVFVLDSNDVAQKNVSVIYRNNLSQGVSVFVRNPTNESHCYSLGVIPVSAADNEIFNKANIEMVMSNQVYDSWQEGGEMSNNIQAVPSNPKRVRLLSKESRVEDIMMNQGEFDKVTLYINFHTIPRNGLDYTFNLIQWDEEGNVVGGETFIIQAPVYGEIGDPVAINFQELDPIVIGGIELSAISEEPLQSTVWKDVKGDIIGNNGNIIVTPTIGNNEYSLIAITNEGVMSQASITLEPTIGIKSVLSSTNANNYIDIEFYNELSNSDLVQIASVSQSSLVLSAIPQTGTKTMHVDTSTLPSGTYIINYIVNNKNVSTYKFIK